MSEDISTADYMYSSGSSCLTTGWSDQTHQMTNNPTNWATTYAPNCKYSDYSLVDLLDAGLLDALEVLIALFLCEKGIQRSVC